MNNEEFLSRLLYRDALMLVLDKPAGIPVHKGTGGGDNLEKYFPALQFGLPRIPALAHRLDRDTSGCLVLGRHRQALHKLGKMFASGRIAKTYWAIVAGRPEQDEGIIDAPLVKQSDSPARWQMRIASSIEDKDAVSAVTHFRVMGSHGNLSWLEMEPKTGRTHQLRVHCAHLGCPIIGDKVYGSGEGMMQLHARAVEIPIYPKKDPIAVVAPVPSHMQQNLSACGYRS